MVRFLATTAVQGVFTHPRITPYLGENEVLVELEASSEIASPYNLEENVEGDELVERMLKGLATLDAESRPVIELVCLQEFSYRETSDMLGISTNKVDYLLRKGKIG